MQTCDVKPRVSSDQADIRLTEFRTARRWFFDITNAGDFASFLVGLVGVIEFKLIGQMFVGDLIFVLGLLYLLPKRGKDLLRIDCALFLLLAAVWLSSQVITDVVRHTVPGDYLRGWAKIATFSANFASAYLLLRTERRLTLYFVGFSFGLLAKTIYDPLPIYDADPWKWAYGFSATTLLIVAAAAFYHPIHNKKSVACVLVAACLNVYFNYRSLGLICFGTGCCLLLSSQRPNRPSLLRLASTLVTLALSVTLFGAVYGYVASNGLLGDKAEKKYLEESEGSGGMLLGGRNEILSSARAIIDSPILGHGSWAKDPQYAEMIRESLAQRGYAIKGIISQDLIPTHSHLAGAWVEAGILGSVIWFFVLFLACRSLARLLSSPLRLRPLIYFCALSLLWDVPFSPFGGIRLLYTPVFILLMLLNPRVSERQQIRRAVRLEAQ